MANEQHMIECAHCGNKTFARIPGTWSLTAIKEGEPIPGLSVPLVVLGCAKCGFVQLFNPQAVPPIPFPEEGGRPVLFKETPSE